MRKWVAVLVLALLIFVVFGFDIANNGKQAMLKVESRVFFAHSYYFRPLYGDVIDSWKAPIVFFTLDYSNGLELHAYPYLRSKDGFQANCGDQILGHQITWRQSWCEYFSW